MHKSFDSSRSSRSTSTAASSTYNSKDCSPVKIEIVDDQQFEDEMYWNTDLVISSKSKIGDMLNDIEKYGCKYRLKEL